MRKTILCFSLFLILTPVISYSMFSFVDTAINKFKSPEIIVAVIPDTDLNFNIISKKLKVAAAQKRMGEKMIVVDPRKHVWKAISANGKVLRSGLATAGNRWCPDIGRPCKTRSGVFRIYSLGSSNCVSKKYPVGRGGAPMPYCMYFNGGQGIHGSYEVVAGNISHGCVRVHVSDARWLRFNFVNVGTKIVIKSY